MLPDTLLKQWVKPFKQQLSNLCLLVGLLAIGWFSVPIIEPMVEDWATVTFVKPTLTEAALVSSSEAEQDLAPLSIIALVDDEMISAFPAVFGDAGIAPAPVDMR